MTTEVLEPTPRPRPFAVLKKRTRFFGLTLDECVKAFFGGNAVVAVLVLGLITIFLFREGAGFFQQYRHSLEVYRRAGLEFVDLLRAQEAGHAGLNRELNDLRVRMVRDLTAHGLDLATANERLAGFDEWSYTFSDAIEPIRALVGDYGELASAIKLKYQIAEDRREERRQLFDAGQPEAAAQVQVEEVDFSTELRPLLAVRELHQQANQQVVAALETVLADAPTLPTTALQARLDRVVTRTRTFVAGFPTVERQLAAWDATEPVAVGEAITGFLTGRQWLTASFWQDWYGIVPLFVGSLLVSLIALTIAVPLGVGGAIYVNQMARPREQRWIKPSIEFISAIPSVVLGFFGVVVLGEALRQLSHQEWMRWFPGFPMAERLNALTAGVLLALIAIPTIFTLAEDALQNVPRAFREASYALGATRVQTIFRIVLPGALSGIISAVLLGFGRVIGETMVVLLVAGNRIAIPDFSSGLGVVTQPVHTMTGIIAQEMGEVVRGSIHYRALFMVGLVLFVLALLINYFAQKIVGRYRLPTS